MQQRGRVGHNPNGIGRMYAGAFDFDTETLETLRPDNSWRNAYTDVRAYLTERGFEWKQGSTKFGDDTADAVRSVRVVQKISLPNTRGSRLPFATSACCASRRATTFWSPSMTTILR